MSLGFLSQSIRILSVSALIMLAGVPLLPNHSGRFVEAIFEYVFWMMVLLAIAGAVIQLIRINTVGKRTVIFDIAAASSPCVVFAAFLQWGGH